MSSNTEISPAGFEEAGAGAVEVAAAALERDAAKGFWTAARVDAAWRVVRFSSEADATAGENPLEWCLVSDSGAVFANRRPGPTW